MGKPSIGDAVTVAAERQKEKEVQELTVLKEDSKESIYYLIFTETKEGGKSLYE